MSGGGTKILDIKIGSTDKLSSAWEATEAFVRGKFIAHSSGVKKENAIKQDKLEERHWKRGWIKVILTMCTLWAI